MVKLRRTVHLRQSGHQVASWAARRMFPGPPAASVGGQIAREAPFPSDRLAPQGKPPTDTKLRIGWSDDNKADPPGCLLPCGLTRYQSGPVALHLS